MQAVSGAWRPRRGPGAMGRAVASPRSDRRRVKHSLRIPRRRTAPSASLDFRAEGLAGVLEHSVSGQRPSYCRSRSRAGDAGAGLRGLGAEVDVVTAYRTAAPAGLREAWQATWGWPRPDRFASPSAVEHLVARPESCSRLPAAVIGPVTESAARDAGLDVRAVAYPSTAAGLVAAVVGALGWTGPPG